MASLPFFVSGTFGKVLTTDIENFSREDLATIHNELASQLRSVELRLEDVNDDLTKEEYVSSRFACNKMIDFREHIQAELGRRRSYTKRLPIVFMNTAEADLPAEVFASIKKKAEQTLWQPREEPSGETEGDRRRAAPGRGAGEDE